MHTKYLTMTPNKTSLGNNEIWLNQVNENQINDYLQPNMVTKLSDDFKSQTLAQIIQHFSSGMVEEFVLYRLMKTEVLPKIQLWYRWYIENMLKRSDRFDENNLATRNYFFNSWSEHIEALESELKWLVSILEIYFSGLKAPADDNLIEQIMKETKRISDTFFPDIPWDVANMIG